MIFVTGDTHRLMDAKKLDIENFPEQKHLTRNDYVIIAGDFGGLWTGDARDDQVIDYHASKNYTTLFVAGNHENYDAINSYPVEEWHGGKIHRIRDNVIHLISGQIFEIEGSRIFVMGGATSVDKMFREEGVSWWPQEEPSFYDIDEALQNLKACNYDLDFIITHTVPETVRRNAFEVYNDFIDYSSKVEQFLDKVLERSSYEKWYAGHIHIDREFPDYKLRVVFNSVIKIN